MKSFTKSTKKKKPKKEKRPHTKARLVVFKNGDMGLRFKLIKPETLPAAKYDNGEDMPTTKVFARFELEEDMVDEEGWDVILRAIGRSVSLLAVNHTGDEEEEEADDDEEEEEDNEEASDDAEEEEAEAEDEEKPAPKSKKKAKA